MADWYKKVKIRNRSEMSQNGKLVQITLKWETGPHNVKMGNADSNKAK